MMRLWHQPLDIPLEYATASDGDHQDATLEAMVDADVIQTGWYFHNPRLNAPYQQDWIEWPMGGDTLAFTIKKGIASATDNPWLVMNVFWLATFPLVALVAQPVLRR